METVFIEDCFILFSILPSLLARAGIYQVCSLPDFFHILLRVVAMKVVTLSHRELVCEKGQLHAVMRLFSEEWLFPAKLCILGKVTVAFCLSKNS